MTQLLYKEDAYLKQCDAEIVAVTERGGIVLDQSVFYATGGGQPGDSGTLVVGDRSITIATTITDRDSGSHCHIPAENQVLPEVGDRVKAIIDWDLRYRYMRMHTSLHLLSTLIPCGVTGGQIGAQKSRLDFDVQDTILDKEQITVDVNQRIAADYPVNFQWITDEELDAQPHLVKTLSVQPPRGVGKIRLVRIGEDIDLQPCGGTHVHSTAEIGKVRISKIENKGRHNRRVHIVFDE